MFQSDKPLSALQYINPLVNTCSLSTLSGIHTSHYKQCVKNMNVVNKNTEFEFELELTFDDAAEV